MAKERGSSAVPQLRLPKSPTGITGFDEITNGGVPKGRPTLVCGGAGSGKTLFAMEFLVRGATEYKEPGVFVAFEETPPELIQNVASLGFRLDELVDKKRLILDHVHIERSEIEVTGEYDLEGLFVRLGYMIDSIGAKRVVLDTLEALFAGLPNEAILRAELRRLFTWLKDKGVTAVITAERGPKGELTRHGLEEYVSDCVILLDHRVIEQVSTRRLRIVKYRGTLHGTNEYPFLIEQDGISLLPITSVELKHKVSNERVSTGVARLDTMLGGGYYKGSTILVSGTAGTGKTSIAASFADAVCRSGKRCLYLAFEESEPQIVRNMRSIGINLDPCIKKGLLKFHASRPTAYGLEMHLVRIHALINELKPDAVIMDPLSSMVNIGSPLEVDSMLGRLIDFLKGRGITGLFTSLAHPETTEQTEVTISSLIDTWILLRTVESSGERNHILHILKSRGMAHSNQVREFHITNNGIRLTDVYIGEGQVFTGSARAAQEARDRAGTLARKQEAEHRQREFDRKRKLARAQMEALTLQMRQDEEEFRMALTQDRLREEARMLERNRSSEIRKADAAAEPSKRTSRK
ncbi:MAG: circadian clock protein KaiC [Alphaproteobacteria bacterium]|uniref:non-specific serine/threonine protein kinase n=1 Tax=Candidatus Nitrobium versatile TaxID=2884831 RepID=A0A953JDS7_9BACT|nr:circadian clock protein KaiC [Candidatus Nitrobium versatile]